MSGRDEEDIPRFDFQPVSFELEEARWAEDLEDLDLVFPGSAGFDHTAFLDFDRGEIAGKFQPRGSLLGLPDQAGFPRRRASPAQGIRLQTWGNRFMRDFCLARIVR